MPRYSCRLNRHSYICRAPFGGFRFHSGCDENHCRGRDAHEYANEQEANQSCGVSIFHYSASLAALNPAPLSVYIFFSWPADLRDRNRDKDPDEVNLPSNASSRHLVGTAPGYSDRAMPARSEICDWRVPEIGYPQFRQAPALSDINPLPLFTFFQSH